MQNDREDPAIEDVQRELREADPADAPEHAEALADDLAARLDQPPTDDEDEPT